MATRGKIVDEFFLHFPVVLLSLFLDEMYTCI